MLTIKVVHRDGSAFTALAQSILTTVHVNDSRPAGLDLLEAEGIATRASAFPDQLTFLREDGEPQTISDGKVYVMNETGKTIDTYYLHGPVAGAAQDHDGRQPG